MADFQVHRINIGISSLPQFQVFITMGDCGVRKEGHVAITNCATIPELEEEVERLINRLRKACDIAKGILEENRGVI
jgi:hypothetical protein